MTNVGDDPQLELVVSGRGGLDVIETSGFGTDGEYFQRRRNYQRLNVYPWAYEDNYFDRRGTKENVTTQTDSLVLAKSKAGYATSGNFTTETLTLSPGCEFTTLRFDADVPQRTTLTVNVRDDREGALVRDVANGSNLRIARPVRLEFEFASTDPAVTPKLDWYSLTFERPDN